MVSFTTASSWNSVRRSHAQYRVRYYPPCQRFARPRCPTRLRIVNEAAYFEGRQLLLLPTVRRLHQINRLVGREVTTQLVVSLILPRLDYCNSLLPGLPLTSLEPLQRVQNAAARLIFNLRPRDDITTALKQLRWLPVEFRLTYKLCLLMYRIHSGHAPQYLSNCDIYLILFKHQGRE
jgi:hypothetical protein